MMYTLNIADIFLPKTKHGDFMYKGYLGFIVDLLWDAKTEHDARQK